MTIKELLRRDWMVSLRHTFRKRNIVVADFLLKKDALNSSNLVILNETPPDMVSILLANIMGVEFVQL